MILIAGVGYSHLSDLSFGPILVEELQQGDWPEDVQIEDLSYGPIAVLQWFQDEPDRFTQAIFIGAMQREGGIPGELRTYRWKHGDFSEADVQERVAEGVTGIVSLENLLMIADYFGVLPDDTLVIEIEPVNVEFALELSPLGNQRLIEVREAIDREVSTSVIPRVSEESSRLNAGRTLDDYSIDTGRSLTFVRDDTEVGVRGDKGTGVRDDKDAFGMRKSRKRSTGLNGRSRNT